MRHIIFILLIVSCTKSVAPIEPVTYNNLVGFKDQRELSCLDYIKIASSINIIDSIFINRDTSVSIFKPVLNLRIYKPVIIIDGNIDFKEWISKSELDSLSILINSDQKSFRLTNSNSSMIDTTLSTVGEEAEFLIDLYNGEKLINSN